MKWIDRPLVIDWRRFEEVGDQLDYYVGWAVTALIAVVIVAQAVMALGG